MLPGRWFVSGCAIAACAIVSGFSTLGADAALGAPTITGLNLVPDRETAETIAVAVSRAMYSDKEEFTKFLPFTAQPLEGNRWIVFSSPALPKGFGPCDESLLFVVTINRDTAEVADLAISHSEGGLNEATPACQDLRRQQKR